MSAKIRVAIVGAGISGLSCAYALRKETQLDITLFEKGGHIGGHSNTIQFTPKNSSLSFPIDTGFLVFNEWTYPGIIGFFKELEIDVAKSEMSFSVSIPHKNGSRLEWAGDNLSTLFAQRKNLLNPSFLKMVLDILRFNRLGKAMANASTATNESVQTFLTKNHFSSAFRDWYLLPMIGAIWSCSITEMLSFPIHTLMRFCQNHGLLNVLNRPQWLTVRGGSKQYVTKVVQNLQEHGITIKREGVVSCARRASESSTPIQLQLSNGATESFDHVIFASHADETISLLDTPSPQEMSILGAISYKSNQAYVHEDRSLLPQLKEVWAAWNYSYETLSADGMDHSHAVCVHYLINKLQPIPVKQEEVPVVVSLNPQVFPAVDKTHCVIEYSHPIFNQATIQAQEQLPLIQGQNNTYFCGAWTRYGFHEDGFQSGQIAANALLKNLSTT